MKTPLIQILTLSIIYSVSAHAYSGKITFISGDVTASRAEPFLKAKVGQVIESDETVKTGPASTATIEFEDGSVIKLNPRSVLTVGKSKTDSEVKLMMGSALSKIAKQKTGQFRLKTQTVTMGVRGTNFFTGYGETKDDAQDVKMAVNEGIVAVEKPGEEPVLVTEGLGIVASPGKKVEAPKAYPWMKKLNWDMSAVPEKKKVIVAKAPGAKIGSSVEEAKKKGHVDSTQVYKDDPDNPSGSKRHKAER